MRWLLCGVAQRDAEWRGAEKVEEGMRDRWGLWEIRVCGMRVIRWGPLGTI